MLPPLHQLAMAAPNFQAPSLTERTAIAKRQPRPQVPATSPTPAPSNPSISAIEVRAANGELTSELRAKVLGAIGTKVGQSITKEQLQQDINGIQALGIFQGFQGVKIEPMGAGHVRLIYVVTLFEVVKEVAIETLPANSSSVLTAAEIKGIFQDLYGQRLNAVQFQAKLKQLESLYKERGYELAQIVNAKNIDGNGKLVLVVAEGLVEDIQVRFLGKDRQPLNADGQPVRGTTRDFIILREMQFKPGMVFNRQTIQKDLQRVYGLRLFEDLGLSLAPGTSDPSKVILKIDVIEGKTLSTNFGGNYGSPGGLSATASARLENLGGNGQKLGVDFQVGRDLLYNLNFTDPWIAGDPHRTSYSVNLFQQRSFSYVFEGGPTPQFVAGTSDFPRIARTGGGITFSRPLDGNFGSNWQASAGIEYQGVTVQDANGNTAVRDTANRPLTFSGTGRDDLLMVQLAASRDSRNSFMKPTDGSLLRVGLDQSVPVGSGNIAMTRLRGNYTQYLPLGLFGGKDSSLALNIQGGTVLGDLPPYEAFSLGGNTLRGYDDGAVGSGKSYAQASAEATFPLIGFVGGALFADYGTDLGTGSSVLGNPAGVRGKTGSGLGYGLGVRVDSPFGPIKLDYGFNDRGGSRLHFGIAGSF
jgi:outer membrane protein insertion porin family